ncbi:acetylglucosaminyltransferase [human gut metagenome]
MCASDLIITRAGAMTLTEITAIGRASVLIPYPYAAENHQYYNALTLQNANAGRIIDDKELTGSVLIDTVNRLADDPELLRLMSENAAKLSKRDAAGIILREITELMGIK